MFCLLCVFSSPRTDFRDSSMGSRTQLRRNLERQQVLEHEEREKQQAQARQSQQQSQTIAMPTSYHSTEVPPKVLQVRQGQGWADQMNKK